MTIGIAALIVAIGQLVVAILSLRAERDAPTRSAHPRLAANQRSLNALLLGATFLAIAAAVLLRVEASNDNYRESSQTGDPEGAVLEAGVAHLLIAIGTVLAVLAIYLAQRAWQGWSGAEPEPRGVAIAATLAVCSGVVTVFLVAAWNP